MESTQIALIRICPVCGGPVDDPKHPDKIHCTRACWKQRLGTVEERFWAKVDKNGPVLKPELGPCWLWTGAKNPQGYGNFWNGSAYIRAPRYAYILAHGPLAPGIEACHKCDNPPCVRDEHLFPGTQAANLADMAFKGRSTLGDRNPSRLYPERVPRGDDHWSHRRPELVRKGSQHHAATLTESQVLEIRRLHADDGIGQHALARAFNTKVTTIFDIVHRNTWSHIP